MKWFFTACSFVVLSIFWALAQKSKIEDSRFVDYIVDPVVQTLKLYWKDDQGRNLSSIGKLKSWLATKGQHLNFAMNGGMYQEDRRPVGLYIEAGKVLSPLNKKQAGGNFYMNPNGVFYISNHTVGISTTQQFKSSGVMYATQSGPMLVINGSINLSFTKGSTNTNIRNGVGILPDGKVLFVLSKQPVSLYDFAEYFKHSGCRNALYLDGFVSRAYMPEKKWMQTDGEFGVMIGVTGNDK